MTNELENLIVDLVAMDRIYVPMSSFDNKLKDKRPKLAKEIAYSGDFSKEYVGERVYARTVEIDKQKARTLKEGIAEFSNLHPEYGKILNGIIAEKRSEKEIHFYFGMNETKRVSKEDYLSVMENLGLSPAVAENFYPVVMDISRNLSKKRQEGERSILIG